MFVAEGLQKSNLIYYLRIFIFLIKYVKQLYLHFKCK